MGEIENSEAKRGLGTAVCTSGTCTIPQSNMNVQFESWKQRNQRENVAPRPPYTAWDKGAQGGCQWLPPGCLVASQQSSSSLQADLGLV